MEGNSTQRTVEALQQLLDLMAVEDFEGENLTWEELANALGVQKKADGNYDGVEFFNACLHAQINPLVVILDDAQRIRVLSSAACAMGTMQSGKL